MDRYNLLKTKFDKKEKIVGTTMTMISSSLILEKMAGREDIDYILFDTEHGIFDAQNLVPLLQTMRLLKIPSFVRVQDAEYHLVAKLIDMGADGIMIPRTETLQQLRTAIDGLLFAPTEEKVWAVAVSSDRAKSSRISKTLDFYCLKSNRPKVSKTCLQC
jgi:2-dehydro-3-deoxyglucarate aldolase/4-hydroxy-2-oxoheptanedioate aldolase